MTETSITNIIIGVGIFMFVILAGTLFVNSGMTLYEVNQDAILVEFNNSNLQEDLNTLEINVQQGDADAIASKSEQSGYLGAIGKMVSQSKAIQNIIKTGTNITKEITRGYVPSLLWWLCLFVLGVIIMMKLMKKYQFKLF